jgi:hypothetical protein
MPKDEDAPEPERLPPPVVPAGPLPLPETDRALLPVEAQALLKGLDDIGGRVDAFTTRVGGVEKVSAKTHALAKWMVGIGCVVAALVVAFVIVLVIAVRATNRANRTADRLAAVVEQRTQSRQVACEQYNTDQLADRASVTNGIQTFLKQITTPERLAQFAPALAALDAQVDAEQALRDCSPDGIARYYGDKP